MNDLPTALKGLAQYQQFIHCRIDPASGRKFPIHWKSQKVVDAMDPANWTSAEKALKTLQPNHYIGFVLTKQDPFFLADVDKCLDPEGNRTQIADWFLQCLPGAAVEISTSGTGLHIIGWTKPFDHTCKNIQHKCELYTHDRYIMLSLDSAQGEVLTDCTERLRHVIQQLFPPTTAPADPGAAWRDTPFPEWSGPADDDELISRARGARSAESAFGGAVTFDALWTADITLLSKAYPPQGSNPAQAWDGSSADMALASRLAYWTGGHHERILRIMMRSSLVRDKWDRPAYLRDTILKAVTFQMGNEEGKQWLCDEQRIKPDDRAIINQSDVFLSLSQAAKAFKDCFYVKDMNRIFMADGTFVTREVFSTWFGRMRFPMDADSGKYTDDAFKAFTRGTGLDMDSNVHTSIFDPKIEPFAVVEMPGGRSAVNTFIPVETPATAGDCGPFFDLLAVLLPEPEPRQILMSYMAAVVQNPGVKFPWALVLQGAQGNGKSLIFQALEHAIGPQYYYSPTAKSLTRSGLTFNSWMHRKLMITVEDAYMGNNADLMQELKPLITQKRIAIEAKGQDQYMAENISNWAFLINDLSHLAITLHDRRYTIISCAQQKPEHLVRDGLTDDYWNNFLDWYGEVGQEGKGLSFINHFLKTYAVPLEYSPLQRKRGIYTAALEQADLAAKSDLQHLVLECVGENRPGFRGGWISTSKLRERILDLRMKYSAKGISKQLEDLGYVKHPALSDGRAQAGVEGHTRLYLHKDSAMKMQIELGKNAVGRYLKDQGYGIQGSVSQPPVEDIGPPPF